jgi:integrase
MVGRKTAKTKAKAFIDRKNTELRNTRQGNYSIKDARKYQVKKIIHEYILGGNITDDFDGYEDAELRKVLKEKGGWKRRDPDRPEKTFAVLWSFSTRHIADLNLYEFSHSVAQRYVYERLEEPRKHNKGTSNGLMSAPGVAREVAMLRAVWKWAIGNKNGNYPELECLANPWEKMDYDGRPIVVERDRELIGDELQRLIRACDSLHGSNRYYIKLAIYLAVETGMRLQEFINIRWEDVNIETRRINIRRQKRGPSNQKIVLPVNSMNLLMQLALSLGQEKPTLPGTNHLSEKKHLTGSIFLNTKGEPMTEEAFSSALEHVRNLSYPTVEDLVVKDFRQTANTFFIKADLSSEERQIMLRHDNKTVNSRHYTGKKEQGGREVQLQKILDKLDRYSIGMTYKEKMEEKHQLFLKACEIAKQHGATEEDAKVMAMAAMLKVDDPDRFNYDLISRSLASLGHHQDQPT